MVDVIDCLYYIKTKDNPWKNLTPNEKELQALDAFDDSLSEEQRKLFCLYDQQLRFRIDRLCQEVFAAGFKTCENNVDVLKAALKRLD